jgi:hypothetical protein
MTGILESLCGRGESSLGLGDEMAVFMVFSSGSLCS